MNDSSTVRAMQLPIDDYLQLREASAKDADALVRLLLLDPAVCSIRRAFLIAAREAAQEMFPDEKLIHFTDAAILARFRAEGLKVLDTMTPEAIATLLDDPDALFVAHRGASDYHVERNAPAGDAPTKIARAHDSSGDTQVARTDLAKHDRLRLVESLAPYLPALLDHFGLPMERIEEFKKHILQQPPPEDGQRFRQLLPQWLASFARERGLRTSPSELPAEINDDELLVIARAHVRLTNDGPGIEEPTSPIVREQRELQMEDANENLRMTLDSSAIA